MNKSRRRSRRGSVAPESDFVHEWESVAGDYWGNHYQCKHCGVGYSPSAHSVPPLTGCVEGAAPKLVRQ